jgi:hypothetical protein
VVLLAVLLCTLLRGSKLQESKVSWCGCTGLAALCSAFCSAFCAEGIKAAGERGELVLLVERLPATVMPCFASWSVFCSASCLPCLLLNVAAVCG